MSVENDPAPSLQAYAHPGMLVTTDWLAAHLGDPGLVVVESDEDVLLYESGHIPGAVKVDWHLELNDQLVRDYLDPAAFAAMCEAKGIGRDDTIVFYGDNFNWWAAYALWVFSLFGHRDVRLLDGGRQKWAAEGRELTRDRTERPPVNYRCRCARTARSAPSATRSARTSRAAIPSSTCARRRSTPAS